MSGHKKGPQRINLCSVLYYFIKALFKSNPVLNIKELFANCWIIYCNSISFVRSFDAKHLLYFLKAVGQIVHFGIQCAVIGS